MTGSVRCGVLVTMVPGLTRGRGRSWCVDVHLDLGGAEAPLRHFPALQRVVVEAETGQAVAERVEGQAGVHERAQNHVAGSAARAVEVGETQGRPRLSAAWRRGD